MIENEIYLDNAATTRTDADLAAELARDMVELFANPSCVHRPGLAAARRLADARREVVSCFRGEPQVVLTASGSEAINLALKGSFARRRRGADGGIPTRIVCSAVEHPAVLNAAKDLASASGAKVEIVPVDAAGRLDLAAFAGALSEDVALVSVMHVQNELGTIEPVAEAGQLVREKAPRAFFLVDAVQSLGKVPIDLAAMRADALAVASHKIHGPKGMGALILRRGAPEIAPLVVGGGQEGGLRSGTENVAGAAAFAKAVKRAVGGLAANAAHLSALRARLLAGLVARIGPDVSPNGPADPALASPAILNISIRGISSETLLHALEQDGIYVSAGSACHSKTKHLSHVYAAARMPEWRADSALRFGLSWHNTEAEVDRAIERVASRVEELRRLAPAL